MAKLADSLAAENHPRFNDRISAQSVIIRIAGKPRRCAYGRLRQQRGDVEAVRCRFRPPLNTKAQLVGDGFVE
jgi:hypothetical protein